MMDARTSAVDAVADEVRAHAVDLLRFDAHARREALRILRELERELARKITASEIEGELTNATRQRLESVLANTRATIGTAYGRLAEATTTLLHGLAQHEATNTLSQTNGAVRFELLTTAVTPNQLRAIVSDVMLEGAPLRDWFARLSGDAATRLADEIRKGMIAGETNADIVRRVRGTRANGFKDGVMEIPRRNAERVVRTAVQTVANQAQVATYRENSDVIKALQHLSVLDGRTSEICVSRSGLTWTLEGKPIGHDKVFLTPPLHWNCRSALVPVLKSAKELGADASDLPPGTRSSMDGQVAADISFDEWLKKKDGAFQDALLGAGKADLWRRGKITLQELTDQTGRPLTLDELAARAAR